MRICILLRYSLPNRRMKSASIGSRQISADISKLSSTFAVMQITSTTSLSNDFDWFTVSLFLMRISTSSFSTDHLRKTHDTNHSELMRRSGQNEKHMLKSFETRNLVNSCLLSTCYLFRRHQSKAHFSSGKVWIFARKQLSILQCVELRFLGMSLLMATRSRFPKVTPSISYPIRSRRNIGIINATIRKHRVKLRKTKPKSLNYFLRDRKRTTTRNCTKNVDIARQRRLISHPPTRAETLLIEVFLHWTRTNKAYFLASGVLISRIPKVALGTRPHCSRVCCSSVKKCFVPMANKSKSNGSFLNEKTLFFFDSCLKWPSSLTSSWQSFVWHPWCCRSFSFWSRRSVVHHENECEAYWREDWHPSRVCIHLSHCEKKRWDYTWRTRTIGYLSHLPVDSDLPWRREMFCVSPQFDRFPYRDMLFKILTNVDYLTVFDNWLRKTIEKLIDRNFRSWNRNCWLSSFIIEYLRWSFDSVFIPWAIGGRWEVSCWLWTTRPSCNTWPSPWNAFGFRSSLKWTSRLSIT